MFKFVQSLVDKFNKQEKNDIQAIPQYIEEKKTIYENLIKFLEDDEDKVYNFNILIKTISQQTQEEPHDNLEEFLHIINSITNNIHRDDSLFDKIYQIIEHYEAQMKERMSNQELFNIFSNNKKLLLYLFKKGIITIDETISNQLYSKTEPNSNRYCHFFYPEMKKNLDEERIKSIEKELFDKDPNILDLFEEKRKEGENDTLICTMIRKDSVEEFIGYVNRNNISLNSEIEPSIFETNSFLIENGNISLIEYATFFGSIQIFNYLVLNKVKLESSLWLYAIHSRNAELIDWLESNKIIPPEISNNGEETDFSKNDYLLCFCESIKCHHNEFAKYIEENFFGQDIDKIKNKNEVVSIIMQSHNYEYFPFDLDNEYIFYYLCCNNYHKLIDLFIKKEEKSIKKMISSKINIL